MKNKFLLLSFWFLIHVILCAQNDELLLETKISIANKNSSQTFILNVSKNIQEAIEGYFYLPSEGNALSGEIIPGGFSFLNDKIFGDPISLFADKWVKNKFPMQDIAPITNRMNVGKVFSFQITPKQIDETGDSMYLFLKYCIYDLIKQKVTDLSFDYKLQLFYKFVAVPFNRKISFDFINAHFKDHTISFQFLKKKQSDVIANLKGNEIIADELMNSVDQSRIVDDKLNIGIEFLRKDIDASINGYDSFDSEFLLKVQQDQLGETKIEKSFQWEDKTLSVPVYYSHLNFPFRLYNDEKEKNYSTYKTRDDIFQSDYHIIIVPVSFNKDTLVADLFITYSKLKTDDVNRWTPIKKRLKLVKNLPLEIELPKENWSMNFTKGSELYDIYGYSDFERYVSEFLVIHFNTNK
ncbi:MAG: hypothetical protein M0P61_09770 [Ignavibacteriaceae bacterium]|jgi:hypothetical protein|nr:hypothetical protein [Ignavibacteriaceae bacterium]